MKKRKLRSNRDGVRYSGNSVIMLQRHPDEPPASFVFKSALYS